MVQLELVGPIRGVQVHEGLAGGRGEVQSLAPDVNLGRLGHHLESPESSSAGGPRVAEDRLVIAVEQGQMRLLGLSRELGRRLLECGLDLVAVAWRTRTG